MQRFAYEIAMLIIASAASGGAGDMDEDDQKPHVSLRELINQRALEKNPTVPSV